VEAARELTNGRLLTTIEFHMVELPSLITRLATG